MRKQQNTIHINFIKENVKNGNNKASERIEIANKIEQAYIICRIAHLITCFRSK